MQVKTSPAHGLIDEEWNRQDPSNILKIDGRYHVWYARYPRKDRNWNKTRTMSNGMEIWLATSEDGRKWKEIGPVLPPSKPGEWHERATHAPHVVPWNGKYHLFLTAFHGPYSLKFRTVRKCFGLAVSDRPEGPYEHAGEEPILSPSDDPDAFSDSEYRQGITWGLSLAFPQLHIFRFDMDARAPEAESGEHDQPLRNLKPVRGGE